MLKFFSISSLSSRNSISQKNDFSLLFLCLFNLLFFATTILAHDPITVEGCTTGPKMDLSSWYPVNDESPYGDWQLFDGDKKVKEVDTSAATFFQFPTFIHYDDVFGAEVKANDVNAFGIAFGITDWDFFGITVHKYYLCTFYFPFLLQRRLSNRNYNYNYYNYY